MAAHRVDDSAADRPQGGFTMIEVMIAILLTVIAVIGMMALFRVETKASSLSRRETEAAVLAQDKIEELRTVSVPLATPSGTDANIDALGQAGGMFTRIWSLTANGDIYDIDVEVTWDDDGVSRSVHYYGLRGSGS
jgi:Tfp pilus assembly protein PilV